MQYTNSIKNWAEDDRPREKLVAKGKNALSDAELLAIIIGSGSAEESAVSLSRKILQSVQNNWNELAKLTLSDLCKFKGIGEAKAVSILTALEIGRRKNQQEALELPEITNSEQLFRYVSPWLSDLLYEEFWIIYLNQKNKIIGKEQISKGGISTTIVDIRVVLKKALELNATAIIATHNHPTGNVEPSNEDKNLTQKLANSAQMLDIKLLDHIIVGTNNYFSFADKNLL